MMTEQEAFDAFLEFEDKNDLFNKDYKGFYYWIYIRYELYSKLVEKINPTDTITAPVTDLKSKIKGAINVLKNIGSELFQIKQANADVLVFQSSRKVFDEKRYIDQYTDFLNEGVCRKSIFVDGTDARYHFKSLKHKREQWNIPLIVANVKFKMTNVEDDELAHTINHLQDELMSHFNVVLPKSYLLNLISKIYVFYKTLFPYYLKQIKRIQPKVIVQLCYYSPKSLVLNEVASLLNIPTIELQHGTMGSGHLAYNYKRKANYPQLPTYMYLFSQYWKDCSRLPLPDENIKITGFPYFESQLTNFSKKNNSVDLPQKQVILFISQTTIGEELSRFAINLSKLIDLDKYEIIYKLHPVESKNWEIRLPELYNASKDITVITSSKESLYSIFSRSKFQVGVYSTAVYEGLGFNLKTYIVPLRGYASMKPLVDMQYATLVQTPSELIDSINRSSTSEIDKNKFWTINASHNIINNIDTLVNQ